jgi:hypothetical protein
MYGERSYLIYKCLMFCACFQKCLQKYIITLGVGNYFKQTQHPFHNLYYRLLSCITVKMHEHKHVFVHLKSKTCDNCENLVTKR